MTESDWQRWARKHPERRAEARQSNYAQTRDGATNARRPWTDEELALVAAHSMSDRALAAKLGRSVQAIQVRRAKMKRDTGA